MRADVRWLAGVVVAWLLVVGSAGLIAPGLRTLLDSAQVRTVDHAVAHGLRALLGQGAPGDGSNEGTPERAGDAPGAGNAAMALMRAASLAFGHVPVLAAAAGWCVYLLWRRRVDAAALLLACVPLGMALNAAVKLAVHRPRPMLPYTEEIISTFSFPSGHAAQSTLLVGWLLLQAWPTLHGAAGRGLATVSAATVVVWVAASRIALGVHYFSDCVAGVLEAVLWLAFCRATAPRVATHVPAAGVVGSGPVSPPRACP